MNQPDELFPTLEEKELEADLTQTLRPVDPPDGFADRVLARIQPSAPALGKPAAPTPTSRPTAAKVIAMPSRRWATGAIAAALLTGAFAVGTVHVQHQREQAELARRQFEAGLRITSSTLEDVRRQLQQDGIPLGN